MEKTKEGILSQGENISWCDVQQLAEWNYMDLFCFFVFESNATNQPQDFENCVTKNVIGDISPYLINRERHYHKLKYGEDLFNKRQLPGFLPIYSKNNLVIKNRDHSFRYVYNLHLKVPRRTDCDFFSMFNPEQAIDKNCDITDWFTWSGEAPAPVFYDRWNSVLIPLNNGIELLFINQWGGVEPNAFPVLKYGYLNSNRRTLRIEDSGDRSSWLRKANGYWF